MNIKKKGLASSRGKHKRLLKGSKVGSDVLKFNQKTSRSGKENNGRKG